MTRKFWVLAFGLALALTGAAGAEEKADPPGTTVFLSRYRAWFALADRDKDGYLDKEELARAFRGASAKPFDYVPPPKPAKDKGEKDKVEKDKADDKGEKDKAEKTDEKDKADKDKADNKDKSTTEKPDKPEKKPDYSRFPDYLFLIQLDKDGDEKVSRAEFEGWATDLAVQLKSQIEAQERLLQLQMKLMGTGLKAGDRRRYQTQVNREQQQLNKLQQQIHKLERHFVQAANKPPKKR